MHCIAIGLLLTFQVFAELPPAGQYATKKITVQDDGLEVGSGVTTRNYQITYPVAASSDTKFPLIVYAHGFFAGATIEQLTYEHHFKDLASYGFVVVAPNSCFLGCKAGFDQDVFEQSNGGIPCPKFPQWPSFVYENARAISYAKNLSDQATWSSLIDWSAGVGVGGHSMGGEAVMQLGSAKFASKYNIKATVCEHCLACIETGDILSTPSMFMTGTLDLIVTPGWVKDAFVSDTVAPRSFRNEKGRGHTEMLDLAVQYNPAVARHAAAFFKVWLTGDRGHYYDIMYGNGTNSFCGYASMQECEHVMSTNVQLV